MITRILAGLRVKIDQGLDREQLFERLKAELHKYEDFPAFIDRFLESKAPPTD